jgi:hypothetical protein
MNKEMAEEIFNDFIELTENYSLTVKAYDNGIKKDKETGEYWVSIARVDSYDSGNDFDIPAIGSVEEWDALKSDLKLKFDNDKATYDIQYPKP